MIFSPGFGFFFTSGWVIKEAIIYGITRIDSDKSRTYAWVVNLSRRRRTFIKHFTDGVYGGKRKALAAAIAYRDHIITHYPPLTLKEFCSVIKRNNRSGIPGVGRYAGSEPRQDGELRWYWIARWSPEPGKTKQIKFSVDKYGEEGAFQRAIRARKNGLAQLQGDFNPGMSK